MTDHVREKSRYKRGIYRITEEPLDYYLVKNKITPPFTFQNTACWRSYEGSWKVKYNKLYLSSIEAFSDNNFNLGLDVLFPGQKEVFAKWYWGIIRLPNDNEEYLPYMFDALLEHALFLKFKNGILINTKVVTDKPM